MTLSLSWSKAVSAYVIKLAYLISLQNRVFSKILIYVRTRRQRVFARILLLTNRNVINTNTL